MEVKITEHGWPAHFCAATSCMYRRNTHIHHGDKFLVVSSVGNYRDEDGKLEKIGADRYYETMMFIGRIVNGYEEAEVSKEISTPSCLECGIYGYTSNEISSNSDNVMDGYHNAIVEYVSRRFNEYYPAHPGGESC